jgi:hypothetical protein
VEKYKCELNKNILLWQELLTGLSGGMDMKKLLGIILVSFLGLYVYTSSSGIGGLLTVRNCFSKTGADFMRMDIEGSSKIKTTENCRDAAANIYKSSGLNGKYTVTEDENGALLKCDNENGHVEIKTRKISGENLIYASFTLSQYNDNMNITNIRRTISKGFSNYGSKPSFSSLIEGKYNESLSIAQMKEKASSVFLSSGASFVDGVDYENMVSISGYIPGIKDKISYMNKLVNLNIALRYSRTDGCTYIWIGSPIILLEY